MKRIGVMLDWSIMENACKGKRTYECLPYYVEIGKELGLEPVFFHPSHVDLSVSKVTGHFWNGYKLIPSVTPIPPVIHNRVLSGDPNTKHVIRELSRTRHVFNELVVRDKMKVHSILWENYLVRPYLPKTVVYTKEKFLQFLEKFPVVYVKPSIGSVGTGVARIERSGSKYEFISSDQRKELSKKALLQDVSKWVGSRSFLIQEGIPLAAYGGRTFDIRVSVQKNNERKWVVSGMVAKLSNQKNKLSNLSRGGSAVPIDTVFGKLFPTEKQREVIRLLSNAAVEIAKQYENHFPTIADLGLDMGVDQTGNPYLIEVNVRDQRYSFYKAGEVEMFKRSYRHPLEYAKSFFPEVAVHQQVSTQNRRKKIT